MKAIGTDANNDIVVSGNRVYMVQDLQAIMTVAKACAQAILGEMIYAKNKGMPYFQTVWVGAPSTVPFEAAFRARMLEIPGVTEVQDFEALQNGDVLEYSARLVTIYGEGTVSNG